MAGIKIIDLPALGRDLISTDLFELSLTGGTGSRKITGQEILNSARLGLQPNITLTTTGSSGSSTFVGNVLNVPTYTLSGLGGVPTTRTLTINGTTQDLSTDRSWTISTGLTIGTTAITSGTVGRVLFEGTGNVVSESANLFWDNTNGRLGIGTSTPSRALDIVKTIASGAIEGIKIEVNHSSSTSAAILDFVHTQFDARFRLQSIAGAGGANPTLSFIVRSATLAMSILQSGNVNIGNTTTDAGYKLDVNGTARLNNSVIAQTVSSVNVLDVSGVRIADDSNGRYIQAINGITLRATATPTTNYLTLSSASVNVWQSTQVIRITASGGATASGVEFSSTSTTAPSNTIMTFRRQRNDGVKSAIICSEDFASSGAAPVNLFIYAGKETVSNNQANTILAHDGTSSRGNILIGTSTNVTSAIVNIESTTQGFLPPRMTNAQRAAIATPAIGLIVYCTDATEGLYVYKSTGWTFIV